MGYMLQRLHLGYLGTATQCLTRDWDCFPHSVHMRTVCLLPSVTASPERFYRLSHQGSPNTA
uniref:Uncharacterized protein n=1 Tax=Bos mutus grunniens TaxID=30521 RepID=A0A8B9X7F2_BOSMU